MGEKVVANQISTWMGLAHSVAKYYVFLSLSISAFLVTIFYASCRANVSF